MGWLYLLIEKNCKIGLKYNYMAHTRDTPETQTKKLLKRGGDRDKI